MSFCLTATNTVYVISTELSILIIQIWNVEQQYKRYSFTLIYFPSVVLDNLSCSFTSTSYHAKYNPVFIRMGKRESL
jgi:hypothetical protein